MRLLVDANLPLSLAPQWSDRDEAIRQLPDRAASSPAQREAAEIQGGSTIHLCESGDIHPQQVVGRRGDRKRITPLFSSPPLFCST